MRKTILRDIEKAIELQEEIFNEYNRLREKKSDFLFHRDAKFTPSDYAQLTLLEHLVNIIIGQEEEI